MNKVVAPVIIIGMHRSGTSMLTRMLSELGLFVGWDYSEEYEALFFYNRNEKILHACGGSWNQPTHIDNLLQHAGLRAKVVELLRRDLSSFYSIYFSGPLRYFKYRSLLNFQTPWGWKDPRNTFLLPIWLDLFPQAKVVHIYRNGLDVASSLAVREVKRIGRATGRQRGFRELLTSQSHQIAEKRHLLYLVRKIQDAYGKMSPINKFNRLKIHPCHSLEQGFALWELYTERAFQNSQNLTNPVFTLKYEDFLLQSAETLAALAAFCGLNVNREQIQRVADRANVQRRFAFQENKALKQLYDAVKDTHWMKKLGYCPESF